MKNRLFVLIGALLVVLQFFQPDRSVPAYDASQDFINQMKPPADVAEMLRVACYDCHSYETEWPWYSWVQPTGWWLGGHVREGREHFNLSLWGTYSAEDQQDILEHMAKAVKKGFMPLEPYKFMHPRANLSDAQRAALAAWLEQAEASLSH